MFRIITKNLAFSLLCAGLLAFGPPASLSAGETGKTSQDLIQYIRDARKLGLSEDQIRQNAIKAGWQSAAVDETLRSHPAAEKNGTEDPPAEADKNRGVPDDYKIGAGDVLQIAVWKEPDVSVPAVVVRSDGKVAMPLLKEVDVLGLTPKQAEQKITEQLAKYIHGVDVTIVVTAVNSKKIYLIGAVKKEGPLPIQYRMTVLQALTEAGGLTDYAKKKKIYVLRNEDGKQYRLPFNYDAVIKGEQMEQNIWLQAGDTVVVPH